MSEPWTCTTCGFGWVVGTPGECLLCQQAGETGGGAHGEREAVNAVRLENASGEEPWAPLYAPGHYPAPVETAPVVNGLGRGPTPGLTGRNRAPQEGDVIARLVKELSQLQTQLVASAQAESSVRAEVTQWQAVAQRERQEQERVKGALIRLQGQVIQLAEANQALRAQGAQGEGGEAPLSAGRSVQTRLARVEGEVGQVSALLETLAARMAGMARWQQEQRQSFDAAPSQGPTPEEDPEAYQTFITTDSQAARIEAEIVRAQAQYGQGWRG